MPKLARRGFLVLLYLSLFGIAFAQGKGLLFHDEFSDPVQSKTKWIFQHGPSEVIDGALVQHCAVEGQAARVFARGGEEWTDYMVECRFKILKTLPNKGGHAGIRVRAIGKDSIYIHLAGSEEGFAWIGFGPGKGKRVEISKGIWHRMKIVCKGHTIEAFLDGKKEFAINNVPFLKGGIDLFSYKVEVAFDDVKVYGLDNSEKKIEQKSSNIIPNSSFEFATAPNLPDYWGIQAWGLAEDYWIGRMGELWDRWRRDKANSYHGNYCMRVNGIKRLASTFIYPELGEKYTLSSYMRTNKEKLPVKILFYNWGGSTWEKKVEVSKQWERYVFVLPTIEKKQVFISFQPEEEGVLWVDAVQMEKGEKVTPYRVAKFDGKKAKRKRGNSLPKVSAYRIKTPVRIDGKLDEPFWQKATSVNFSLINGGKPKEPTQAFVAFDQKNIYLGFKCFDSQMPKVREKILKRDGQVWTDDSVEIFVDPSGTREDYYHFGVSITGAKFDALKMDPSWNREWQAATTKYLGRWETEIAFPLAIFDLSIFNQDNWALNLCRENHKISEYSCWSPTYGSFHNAEYFGILKALPKDVIAAWFNERKPEKQKMFYSLPITVKGKPFFAYALAWQSICLPGKNAFKVMRDAGFNSLILYFSLIRHSASELREVLDLAKKYNIKIVYWIGGVRGAPSDKHLVEIKRAIETFKTHPAIIAWLVMDEPHSNPEKVIEAYQLAKKLDPLRSAFINLTPYGLGMRIANVPGDIISVDLYTINFDGSIIKDIGPLLRQAGKESAGKRPVWIFLQGMSNLLQVWRGPTPEEQTAQTYLAVVSGATGIFYFNVIILPTNTWQRTKELAKEIKFLTPALVSDNIKGVTCNNPKIEYVCKEHKGSYYLIAVNPFPEEKDAIFDLKSLGFYKKCKAKALFESRNIEIQRFLLKDTFKPYQRHCYKLTPIQ